MKRAKSIAVGLGLVLLGAFACTSSDTPASSGTAETTSGVRVLAAPDCPHVSCEGPLEPGQYRATYYDPAIAFEISSPGWTWSYSGNFVIVADDSSGKGLYSSDGIYFFVDPAIASQNCQDSAARRVGRSVNDLVAWLEAAPGLAVSEPTTVTVGGLEGVRLDLQLDPEWTKTCFWSEGLPAVPLIFNGADVGGYNWAIIPGMSMRWYIVDSGDGVIIVDIDDNPRGLAHDDLLRTGSEIVDSLVFSSPS